MSEEDEIVVAPTTETEAPAADAEETTTEATPADAEESTEATAAE